MDRYDILFSADALEDMYEITKYIREKFASPSLAEKYFGELFDTVKSLEYMPSRFEKVKMKYIKRDNVRKIIYKDFLAFYSIDAEKQNVYVLRVRYSKTDWKATYIDGI